MAARRPSSTTVAGSGPNPGMLVSRPAPRCCVIALHGVVGLFEARLVERAVVDELLGGARLFVVDLRGVTEIGGGLLVVVPRRRCEQAIVAVVMAAYVNGVSTRKVDRLVEQLGIQGMSKDRVSRLCPKLGISARGELASILERPT